MLKGVAITTVLIAAACDDATIPPGGDPGGLAIAWLEIGPDPLVLLPGDTIQLTAVARSASGAIIANPPVTWVSSDTTALTISATGKATSLRVADSVRITARAETRTASFEPNLCPDISYAIGGRFRFWGWSGRFEQGTFDGTHVLHSAGIMYGTNETDFVIVSSPTGLVSHAGTAPTCQLELPDGRYIRTRITLRDGLTNGPVSPVRVTQEIFGPSHPLAEGVILIRYTFRNIATQPVDNFRLGVWFDWDLLFNTALGPGKNYARFNPVTGTAEAFEATMETAGIAGINTPITSYVGLDHIAFRTVAEHMALLTSGIMSEVSGPADIRFAAGFGPFTIAPGQSRSVMMVMTVGRTREEFERRISIGRSAASVFPSVATPLSP